MTGLAVVILAHQDPGHVTRLVGALAELPVVLHWDARTEALLAQLRPVLPSRVTVIPSTRTSISSWSLVEAELRALREALANTRARHIAVLTGADYPLVGVAELLEVLDGWEGSSFVYNLPVPLPQWSSGRHADGGLWRFRYRFLTWRGQLMHLRGMPLHWPLPRALPPGLELRASTQWKIYAREHAELLLRIADTRSDLIRFWQHTLIPEESFAASVLGSPRIAGAGALRPCRASAWYYDFQGEQHPRWLTAEDLKILKDMRHAPALDPASAFADPDAGPLRHRKLFARKFSSERASRLLDHIDTELRDVDVPVWGGRT